MTSGLSLGDSMREKIYVSCNRLVAALLLCALLPVFVIIALALWLADGFPITFGHDRIGQNRKSFRCLKFRTMTRDADKRLADLLATNLKAKIEWDSTQKLKNDPRITWVGKFLRKTSLDELPQLWNVLRGEMNLVGPRPITEKELVKYGRYHQHYTSIKPGITGLWQVSGRNNTTYERRVDLDVHYVENRTVWLDLWILLRTVKVLITRDGAM